MAKIETYAQVSPVAATDLLIGTDVNANNATKNFSVGDLKSYINGETSYSTLLSKADILLTSGATADIEIVPAQGVNILTVVSGVLIEIFGSIPYVGPGVALTFKCAGGTSYFLFVNNLFNATTSKKFFTAVTNGGPPTTGATYLVANAPIEVTGVFGQPISDSGTSDLTLKITTFYTLISV